MKIEIRNSFVKDADKLSASDQRKLAAVIELIDKVPSLQELPNLKKLQGYKTAYRLRMGNYRLGFFFENNTVELVRILARKDVYRYFP